MTGPFVYDVLSTYRTLPLPTPLVFTPVFGVLVYWWSEDVRSVITVFATMLVAAGVAMVAVLSIPAFVLDVSAGGRAVIYQTAIFRAFTALVLSIPFTAITLVLASVLDTETTLLSWIDRGRPDTTLVSVTVGLVAFSVLLTGVVGLNYASAADQSRVSPTIEGVDVENEQVVVSVTVPNRLRSPMTVQSIVLDIRLNESENLRVSRVVNSPVRAGETARYPVTVPTGELPPSQYRLASSVHIEGVVRISAFNDYDADLSVTPYDA